MTNWTDIATIAFISVAANHLGLVSAVERSLRLPLPIINCPKCFAFWLTLAFCLPLCQVADAVAVSFLNAWLALWLELAMGATDKLYMTLYDKIYDSKDNEATADTNEGDSASTVSEL